MSKMKFDGVLSAHELTQDHITGLIDRSITAVRIPKWYNETLCNTIADRLTNNSLYGNYINAPKIARVGQAFFESQASAESQQRYNESSVKWVKQMRHATAPYLSPIDKLRVEVDEVWNAGSHLYSFAGTKMFAGLGRHFTEGSEADPHTDVFAWDTPDDSEICEITDQLAWNVYLSMPEEGGQLTLWDEWPDKAEYEQKRILGSYGLQRNMLKDPVASITPDLGEAIFFNPRRVHAVERVTAGSRVTWSCFVGYRGPDKALVFWS